MELDLAAPVWKLLLGETVRKLTPAFPVYNYAPAKQES